MRQRGAVDAGESPLRTNDDEISTRREFTLEVLTDHLVYSLWLKMDFRYCFVIAVSLRCIRDAA